MESLNDISKTLTTIRDYIRWSMGRFTQAKAYYGHGTDNAWDEAVTLIFHLLHLPRDTDERVFDAVLTKKERELIVQLVETRCHDKIPVAYLTGEAWFAGMRFKVDERVLIPRSPIAELIENHFQPWVQLPIQKVLDLGTGSGCIGLACAAYLDTDVDLVDLSSDALEIARQNIAQLGLAHRAKLIQSDVFDGIDTHYDLIVSNPPYVDEHDFATMPHEYQHEPEQGLKAGPEGLDIANRILAESAQYLNDGGILVLEVGNSWEALEEAYPKVPFTWVEFERGGHGVCVMTKQDLLNYF